MKFKHMIYSQPQRPKTGMPLGIWESFWIYTDKWAWGFGKVQDWAVLDKVEIEIPGRGRLLSEFGSIKFTWDKKPDGPISPSFGASVPLEFHNRQTVEALLDIQGLEPPFVAIESRGSKAVLVRNQEPLEYSTLPTGSKRWVRLFGRPEFLTR